MKSVQSRCDILVCDGPQALGDDVLTLQTVWVISLSLSLISPFAALNLSCQGQLTEGIDEADMTDLMSIDELTSFRAAVKLAMDNFQQEWTGKLIVFPFTCIGTTFLPNFGVPSTFVNRLVWKNDTDCGVENTRGSYAGQAPATSGPARASPEASSSLLPDGRGASSENVGHPDSIADPGDDEQSVGNQLLRGDNDMSPSPQPDDTDQARDEEHIERQEDGQDEEKNEEPGPEAPAELKFDPAWSTAPRLPYPTEKTYEKFPYSVIRESCGLPTFGEKNGSRAISGRHQDMLAALRVNLGNGILMVSLYTSSLVREEF